MDITFTKENLSIGKILGLSWELFTKNFKEIAIIVMIVYIPVDLILLFANNISPDMEFRTYWKMINYLETLIGIIATLGIAVFLIKKMNNEETTPMESIKEGLSSYWSVLGASIITGLMIGLLTLLFIVPGVIYGVYWIFVTYIVLVHKKNASSAREYSKSIVQGRWWTVFGYSFVFGLLTALAGFVLGMANGFTSGIIAGLIPIDSIQRIYIISSFTFLWNITIDIGLSFFTVVSFIFFLSFDATKNTEITETKKTEPSNKETTEETEDIK